MPYKLVKAPGQNKYWVVAIDGQKKSKEPLPKKRAEAQMRALYAAMRGKEEIYRKYNFKGGAIDTKSDWLNPDLAGTPMEKEAWLKVQRAALPVFANDAGYAKYLSDWDRIHKQMAYKYDPNTDKAVKCPPDAVKLQPGQRAEGVLPPGTKYCVENPDGSISQGTTMSEADLASREQEKERDKEIAKNNKKFADERYYAEHPTSAFFNRDVNGALVKVGDAFAKVATNIVPGTLGKVVKSAYTNFAPPGSEYHTDKSFGEKLANTASDLVSPQGAGLLTAVQTGVKKVITRVSDIAKGIRKDYTPSARTLIKQIGDVEIASMVVFRTPLAAPLTKALNLLTLGQFGVAQQKAGYDKLFHLGIEFRLQTGAYYVLEKNQVINIAPAPPSKKDTQRIPVPMSQARSNTLNGLLRQGQAKMGQNWYVYDALKNNCQDFCIAILQANGQLNPDLTNFIKQPLEVIVQNLPSFAGKVANYLTDLGALADVAIHGQGGGRVPGQSFKAHLERINVNPEAYLREAQHKLGNKNLGFSDDDRHKLQVPNKEGKIIRFGAVGSMDYIMYKTIASAKVAKQHQKAYLARATKIKGDWKNDPYSANSLAIKSIW